ncbi:lytic transglycosylase domain-containing protein [Paenibacillus sp. D2_2]|uniref:lytic transglycosylase domain-containing protein n=1 Tax=Paenibacillus sp. D2_2 TaxID=3073092 RepID=UPI0028155048|nr:lytic transglycosylase domain-containing protein [Paenibacillus sp. D2_2]WMT39251.1 lytic transglycosylase domain-containing protein [Paenibacillus sp. D2_2]
MDARKRIAVVSTAAIASVVVCGGLTLPKGTENEPVASTTVIESDYQFKQAELFPCKVQSSLVETVKDGQLVVKHAEEGKKKVVDSDIIPSITHDLIADVMEKYIEDHNERRISRKKILQYIGWVDTSTKDVEIDTLWIMAMMWQESRFQNTVESSSGAVGLLQILPSTAKDFGVSRSQLSDPKTNIKTSIKYLSYLLDRYDGNLRTATIAYNQGEGNVDKGKARSWYYNSVKKHYDKMARMLEEARQDR